MTSSLSSGLDWIGLASSFLLVLGLLALLLFALKRMQAMSVGAGGQRQIQLLETLTAGNRQKIVLLRVKDRDILVGVSATQITPLAQWPEQPGTGTGPGATGQRTVYAASGARAAGSPSALGDTPSTEAGPSVPTPATGTPRFAADPRIGNAPSGAMSFAAVLEHARMPNGLVQLFKRKA